MAVERVDASGLRHDWEQCARIHEEAISEGFLSTLGADFLITLYQTLAMSPSAFLLVDRGDDGSIHGFICGSEHTGRVYKEFVRKVGLRILPTLLPRVLSPKRLVKAIETGLYPSRTVNAGLPQAEILNFCVSRDRQGCGSGRRLFGALSEEFVRRGVDQIRIVTGAKQVSAQRFYEAAGARRVGDISVHAGSPEFVYVYTLPVPDVTARDSSLSNPHK